MKLAFVIFIFHPALYYCFVPLRNRGFSCSDNGRQHGLWSSVGHLKEQKISLDDQDSRVYSNHIRNLSMLLDQGSEMIQQMKRICHLIQEIELNHPEVTKLGKMSTVMAQALSEAKAADDVFGPNSVEANTAWDIAEMASTTTTIPDNTKDFSTNRYREAAVSSHHNYMTVVDWTTLDHAIDAFGKIEHLHRLVKMENHRIENAEDDVPLP